MMISEILLKWYYHNKRELPWREKKFPYQIWLSEVIFQQTRINQGLPYYHKFIDHYPEISDLANTSIDKVMLDWQGLGYYSRARNLHKCANIITKNFNGDFPETAAELKKLPGIGEYTAAAIASICFNEKIAVVDGNVQRVISRLFAVEEEVDSTEGKKKIRNLVDSILPEENYGDFNQSMMDFGAMICLPKNPKCDNCPLVENCLGFAENKMLELPKKKAKIKVRNRFFNFAMITDNEGRFLIRKRDGKDIWNSLFEFPLVESKKEMELDKVVDSFQKEFKLKSGFVVTNTGFSTIHKLSHQHIYASFIHINLNESFDFDDWIWVSKENLGEYAFPQLIRRFLDAWFKSSEALS